MTFNFVNPSTIDLQPSCSTILCARCFLENLPVIKMMMALAWLKDANWKVAPEQDDRLSDLLESYLTLKPLEEKHLIAIAAGVQDALNYLTPQ